MQNLHAAQYLAQKNKEKLEEITRRIEAALLSKRNGQDVDFEAVLKEVSFLASSCHSTASELNTALARGVSRRIFQNPTGF